MERGEMRVSEQKNADRKIRMIAIANTVCLR